MCKIVFNNIQMASIEKLYFNIPRKTRLFLFFLVIILVAYFVGRFIFVETRNIPIDFLKARQEASLISQDIVNLSNDSAKRIDQILILNKKGEYIDALNLIVDEINKNREVRQSAILLSGNLQTMAQNASDISPDSSAKVALEAIGVETTIISRLVDYNDYLNQLLEILRAKLLGKEVLVGNINDLVKKVNEEAINVNDLNKKFNDLMSQFDSRK